MGRPIVFPMPRRLVVIGDLNGDDDALQVILRALRLVDREGAFVARGVHLVQIGDVMNRGARPKAAIERLMRLGREAEARQSRVTMILGNHEAMMAMGNLAWCSPEEQLEHATPAERGAFEERRNEVIYRLLRERGDARGTSPIVGALRAWEEDNAPGRAAMQQALSREGDIGRYLRSLPAAIRVGPVVLSHAGISEGYAARGIDGIDAAISSAWRSIDAGERPVEEVLLDEDGPLWNRRFALFDGPEVEEELARALALLGASAMIVGHTRTDQIPGGQRGLPSVRFQGRLVCADVGIGTSGGTLAALLVEKGAFWCWRPDEPRRRLGPLPQEASQGRRKRARLGMDAGGGSRIA